MENKITLIIPDIHLKWEMAEKIIENVKHDDVIFLGDYFDDFGDNSQMVTRTAEWLVASVNKPNRVHLFGNHDVQYAFPYKKLQCSGYEQWKYFIIYDIVPREIWDKVKFYHVLDNTWLLSHAGIHTGFVPKSILKLKNDKSAFFKEVAEYLDHETIIAFRDIANNSVSNSWLFGAGHARWGTQTTGGLLWCDYEQEFKGTIGLNQIVGHTPQRSEHAKWLIINEKGDKSRFYDFNFFPLEEGIKDPNRSTNIDIDVWKNMHYAVWDGKVLTIGNYDRLFPSKKP